MEKLLERRKREFRSAGLTVFAAATGLLALRVLFNLLGDALSDLASDVLFSCLMQIGVLLIGTFVCLRLTLRRSTLGVLEYANVRRPSWKIMLLCVPLGICVYVATIGVSTVWLAILMGFGYTPSSGTPLPESFSFGALALELFITAVLPGVCEEFTNRGAYLTALRNTFSKRVTVVLCGVAFGLFHQNITQVFYASCFGMLMAYLVIEGRSVFPAMVVHFTNNALSVYTDYASAYDIPLSGLMRWLSASIESRFALLAFLFVLTCAAGVLLYIFIIKLSRKHACSEMNGIRVLGDEPEGGEYLAPTLLYKPTLADWTPYIGALVMTVLTTVATFIWGL